MSTVEQKKYEGESSYALSTTDMDGEGAIETNSCDESEDSNDFLQDPAKTISWLGIAGILCAEVIGCGVLTIGVNVARVGWIPGIILLLINWPIAAYVGLLFQRTILKVPDRRRVPNLLKLCQELTTPAFALAMQIMNWVVTFFVVTGFVSVAAQALASIFYDFRICMPIWGCIVIPIIITIMSFTRTQRLVSMLTGPSMVFVAITIIISVAFMLGNYSTRPALEYGNTPAVKEGLTLGDLVYSFNQFLFSYSGQNIFVEIISEMKHPKHFPKSIVFSGTVQVSMYVLVAIVSNLYSGMYNLRGRMITENIGFNAWFRVANLFLFLHVVMAIPITCQVLCRNAHFLIDMKTVNENSVRGRMVWILSCIIVVGLSGSIAILFPFLDIIQNFCGALLTIPCFILPGITYIRASKIYGTKIHMADKILMTLICFMLGSCLFGYGIYLAIDHMADSIQNAGGFLACNCQGIWNSGCTV